MIASIHRFVLIIEKIDAMNLLMWNENKRETDHLSKFFETNGFVTSSTSDFKELLDKISSENPDLILLSVDSSTKNGLDLCQRIKSEKRTENIFVVFMSNRKEEEVQVLGLEAGADDFLILPITQRLFLKRINALLKRKKIKSSKKLAKAFMIDQDRYLIIRNGEEIFLPRKEFQILSLLYSKPEKVFSRDEIKNSIWENFEQVRGRTIDVHIRKIREKIGEDIILTIKGEGYRLQVA